MASLKQHETLILTPSEDYPGQVECRSTTYGITAYSHSEKRAIAFVKGATLCAIGELWQELPDEFTIVFKIDRSALEGIPVQP